MNQKTSSEQEREELLEPCIQAMKFCLEEAEFSTGEIMHLSKLTFIF